MSPRKKSPEARLNGTRALRRVLFEAVNHPDATPLTIAAAVRQAKRTFAVSDDDYEAVIGSTVYYRMILDAELATDAALV